jgi:hypothetical protein
MDPDAVGRRIRVDAVELRPLEAKSPLAVNTALAGRSSPRA